MEVGIVAELKKYVLTAYRDGTYVRAPSSHTPGRHAFSEWLTSLDFMVSRKVSVVTIPSPPPLWIRTPEKHTTPC